MLAPPQLPDEASRLADLYEYDILDTAPEKLLDDLVLLVSRICDTPIALISLVDRDRQWIKAGVGLNASEAPRSISVCGHTIASDSLFVVEDASLDPRFADNPLVIQDPHIRFYAGAPLITPRGHRIGTLCAIDRRPRILEPQQLEALKIIAGEVVDHLESGRTITRLETEALERDLAYRHARELEERFFSFLDGLPQGIFTIDRNGHPYYENQASKRLLGKDVKQDVLPDELATTYGAFIAGTDEIYPTERMPVVRALRGEATRIDDMEIRALDGIRLLEVTGTPIYAGNGELTYAIASFTDITERRRVEEELEKQSLYLSLLHSVSAAADGAPNAGDAITAAIREVCEITGWSLGHAWIISPDRTQFVPHPTWWNTDPRHDRLIRLTNLMRLPLDAGLPGRVLTSGHAEAIADVTKDSGFIRAQDYGHSNLRSAFAFPVTVEDEITAVLEFFAEAPPPEPGLVAVMERLGNQLGHTIARKRGEEALRDSEARFRDLVENSLDLIGTHDLQGVILSANRAFVAAMGGRTAADVIGMNIRDIIVEQFRDQFDTYVRNIVSHGQDEGLMTVRTAHGRDMVIEYRNTLRSTEPGSMTVRAVARDITARWIAERKLTLSEERYRLLFERNVAGVFRTTMDGAILDCNDAFAHLMGYVSPEELQSVRAQDLYMDREDRRNYLARLEQEGTLNNIEERLKRKDGTPFWGLLNVTLIDQAGARLIEGTLIDISERRRIEESVRYHAYHDPLTGLPNRLLFFDRLRMAIAEARRDTKLFALCYIDLDRFKPVNDEFGHAAGDWLLREVAQRLTACARESDSLARLGGDEFALILRSIHSVEDAESAAQKLVSAIAAPFDYDGHAIHIGASFGISLFPENGEDADTLLRSADAAMYRSKGRGGNQFGR